MNLNESKHNSLTNKELRDFLGKTIHEDLSTYIQANGEDKEVDLKIKKLEKEIFQLKYMRGIGQVMKKFGWSDWDVSEEVDYVKETYFSFIGNVDEYNNYLKNIREAKNEFKR